MIRRQVRRLNADGFTLIELLIVIIVLGILVAIVLFSLGTFKSDSSSAACATDAKQVRTAEAAFFLKNGSYATNLSDLVTANLLQTVPATDNYTIVVDGSGNVSGCP